MTKRVKEKELVVPTLRLAASRSDGFISTSELIEELGEIFAPVGVDAQILGGRRDTYFSQKVRNLISHRGSSSSFIENGYAEYVSAPAIADRGIRITEKGRQFLTQLGDDDE